MAPAVAQVEGSRSLSSSLLGLPDAATGALPSQLPCSEPVRRARVELPRHLLFGSQDTVMYSGYVNVTQQDYLFYWFVEAQEGAPTDAPLIVWSNGGPGCSSMEGVTTENGPLVLFGFRKQLVGRLSKNPYSWNRRAHVLYVDQPRYVGFSVGTGPYARSSRQAGLDMVQFLRGWRALFPEHAARGIILSAESYGGHFVPAWSAAILDHNRRSSDPIRVDGIAIGNGAIDEEVQDKSFAEFVRTEGLISEGVAELTSFAVESWGQLMGRVTSSLGYVPNYYDYRVVEEECCGCSSYNYKGWSDWLLRTDVTRALNVCGNAGMKAFANCNAGCIEIPDFDKNDTFDYREALSEALQAGIKVTFYYGMTDTVCNYIGGSALAHSLRWSGSSRFRHTPMQDLIIQGARTGQTKAYGGLTWIQVEGAGHMVPVDNPAAAYHAISTLISQPSGCEGGILSDGGFIQKASEEQFPEEAASGGQRAVATAAFLTGCLASATGLLVLGGRAVLNALRQAGSPPRLYSSPLGQRSPLRSRSSPDVHSPEYMIARSMSSGTSDGRYGPGPDGHGWLDA